MIQLLLCRTANCKQIGSATLRSETIRRSSTSEYDQTDDEPADDEQTEETFSEPEYDFPDEQDDEDDLIGSMSQHGQDGEDLERDADLESINSEIQSQAAKLNLLTEHEPANHEIIEQTDVTIDKPMLGSDQVERVEHRYVASNQPAGSTHRTAQAERDYEANANPYQRQEDVSPESNSQTKTQNDLLNDLPVLPLGIQHSDPSSDPPNGHYVELLPYRGNRSTLPSSPNLGNRRAPFHNNIFVIQSACRKSRKRKKAAYQAGNQSAESKRSGKKLKKSKSRRITRIPQPDPQRKKRKRKRQPKQKEVIVIEEDNYVPAYKEKKSYESREIEV